MYEPTSKLKFNYQNIIQTFISQLTVRGKKKKFSFVLQFFVKIDTKKAFKNCFLFIFILYRIRPIVELRRLRKGSSYYIVPMPFRKRKKSIKRSFFWISRMIKDVKRRHIKTNKKAEDQFNLILKRDGVTWRNFQAFQKKSLENLIYSHYRW